MNLTVATYLLYLAITIPLTLWVAHVLHRHGHIFLNDVFSGDTNLAKAVNQLLVIGFYLLNLGYVALFMTSDAQVSSVRRLMEVLSAKVGAVAIVLGVVHLANVWALNALRRRALLRAKSLPPLEPNGFTPVMAAAGPGAVQGPGLHRARGFLGRARGAPDAEGGALEEESVTNWLRRSLNRRHAGQRASLSYTTKRAPCAGNCEPGWHLNGSWYAWSYWPPPRRRPAGATPCSTTNEPRPCLQSSPKTGRCSRETGPGSVCAWALPRWQPLAEQLGTRPRLALVRVASSLVNRHRLHYRGRSSHPGACDADCRSDTSVWA